VKDAVGGGKLRCVLSDWQIEPLPVWIMYHQKRHLSAKVRVFVEWIADLFTVKSAQQTGLEAAHAQPRRHLAA